MAKIFLYGVQGQYGNYCAAQEQGRIYAVLPGERLTIFDEEARRLMARCPALRDDCDRERYNCGVTFVIF